MFPLITLFRMRPTFENSKETNQEILNRLGGSFKIGFLVTRKEVNGVMKELHHRSICEFELIDLTQDDDDDWQATPTFEKATTNPLNQYQDPIKCEENILSNQPISPPRDPYQDPQPSTSSGITRLRDLEVTRPLPIDQLQLGADHDSSAHQQGWKKLIGAPIFRTERVKATPWVKGHTPPRQTENDWTVFRWKLQTRERRNLKRLRQARNTPLCKVGPFTARPGHVFVPKTVEPFQPPRFPTPVPARPPQPSPEPEPEVEPFPWTEDRKGNLEFPDVEIPDNPEIEPDTDPEPRSDSRNDLSSWVTFRSSDSQVSSGCESDSTLNQYISDLVDKECNAIDRPLLKRKLPECDKDNSSEDDSDNDDDNDNDSEVEYRTIRAKERTDLLLAELKQNPEIRKFLGLD